MTSSPTTFVGSRARIMFSIPLSALGVADDGRDREDDGRQPEAASRTIRAVHEETKGGEKAHEGQAARQHGEQITKPITGGGPNLAFINLFAFILLTLTFLLLDFLVDAAITSGGLVGVHLGGLGQGVPLEFLEAGEGAKTAVGI